MRETFTELEEQIKNAVLSINQDETKYMCVSRSGHNERNTLDVGGYSFEQLDNFIYLGSLLNEDNLNSEEIRSRIAKGNRA